MLTCYAIEYDPNNELLHAATGDNNNFGKIYMFRYFVSGKLFFNIF